MPNLYLDAVASPCFEDELVHPPSIPTYGRRVFDPFAASQIDQIQFRLGGVFVILATWTWMCYGKWPGIKTRRMATYLATNGSWVCVLTIQLELDLGMAQNDSSVILWSMWSWRFTQGRLQNPYPKMAGAPSNHNVNPPPGTPLNPHELSKTNMETPCHSVT